MRKLPWTVSQYLIRLIALTIHWYVAYLKPSELRPGERKTNGWFKNWSTSWKFSTTASSTFVSFAQGFGPLAIAPMLPELAQEFQQDLPSVVQFTGVTILVLGFSNFIWFVHGRSLSVRCYAEPLVYLQDPSELDVWTSPSDDCFHAAFPRELYLESESNHV